MGSGGTEGLGRDWLYWGPNKGAGKGVVTSGHVRICETVVYPEISGFPVGRIGTVQLTSRPVPVLF